MIVLLWLACAGAPTPPPPVEAPAAVAPQAGVVVMVNHDEGTTREVPVDSLPETMAWATVDGVRVPVARIESRLRGAQLEVTRFGADGALLDVTTMVRPR